MFFLCQVSASKLRHFARNALTNDIYSKPIKTVFSHLKVHPNQTQYIVFAKINLCTCL